MKSRQNKFKSFVKIAQIFFIICFLFLGWGCGKKEEAPKKSTGVSKKIEVSPKKIPKPAATPKLDSQKKNGSGDDKTKGSDSQAAQANQPEEEEIEDIYDPMGKIDPFAPLVQERKFVSVEKASGKRRHRVHLTPLEKVDLSQLKLTAIVLATSGNRAIVTESDGKGYVITNGTYIGVNSGKVAQILLDRVIVEEEIENILGRISIRKRELKLQKPPGE